MPQTKERKREYAKERRAQHGDKMRAKYADVALREATNLLESFVAQHFPSNADWKPQPDLVGVILQLSNAVVIASDYKAEMGRYKDEIERLDREVKALRVIADGAADDIERLRVGLRMLATQEYDAGYSPEEFADAVLSGHEPGK